MDELKKNYFAVIPASVRYDDNIPPNAKLLYGEITALCNEKGYCWASNDYFAKLYKVTKSSVTKWISALHEQGYIIVELKYKEGTKEIENRIITLSEKITTPIVKNYEGYSKNLPYPIVKNYEDNNTYINNTINNTINNNKSKATTTKKFVKPTVEDIQNYCSEKGYKIDAQYFIDYYESKGWLIGKAPMKDWKAAIRNWARREYKNENKEEVKKSWWEDTEQDTDSIWNL